MEDPEFRQEYALADDEFALIEALVRAPRGGKFDPGGARRAPRHDPVRHRATGGRPGVAVLRHPAPLRRSDRNAADGGPGTGRRMNRRDGGTRPEMAQTDTLIDWPEEGVARAPYAVFSDPEIYAAEMRRIFRGPVWHYLGLEAELPEPGDYRLIDVGDTPVIVLRNPDGGINALVNRCAHKGNDDALRAVRPHRPADVHLSQLVLRPGGMPEERALREGESTARAACRRPSTWQRTGSTGCASRAWAGSSSARSPTRRRRWKPISASG